MKLKTKITLVLSSVIGLSVVLNFAVMQQFVFPSFVSLERLEAERNMERVQRAIDNDLDVLGGFAGDWGHWDDTYEFAVDENEEYRKDNIYLDAFAGMNISLVYYYNADGEVLVEQLYDFEAWEEIDTEGFTLRNLPKEHWLLQANNDDLTEIKKTVISTNLGPALVGAATILTSEYGGPPHGTLVMGRLLTEVEIEALRGRTNVDFSAWSGNRVFLAADDAAMWDSLAESGQRITLRQKDKDTLSAYATIGDPTGETVLYLRADTPREITGIGGKTLRVALLWIVGAGLATMLVMLVLLQKVMINPITKLTDIMHRIVRSGDLEARVEMSRSDEVGVLGNQFNHLLENLSVAQRHLAEDSFLTGMAETAAGVMHNVRNQMHPLLVTLGQTATNIDDRSDENLKKAISELGDADASNDRKQKLLDYVDVTIDERIAGDRKLADGLRQIATKVMEIDEILSQHQSAAYAERGVTRASIDLAIATAKNVLLKDGNVAAVKILSNLKSLPAVRADGPILSQVFGNLLLNAERAVREAGVSGGEILVSGSATLKDGEPVVHIVLRDNGVGMDRDTLEHIFERGYTTKKDGKGGLGLHWCANTLALINGRIWAESEGIGKGSTFHVEIPQAHQLALEPVE